MDTENLENTENEPLTSEAKTENIQGETQELQPEEPVTQTEEPEPARPVRRKKKKKGLIILLVVLILAVAGGVGYYFGERQQSINTVKAFLTDVQNMNFEGMEAKLQSNDLAALDNADITNETYRNFFQTVNQKMSFDIKHTEFNLINETATVTARIKYVDGADIYKETITEFLKQIVATAFSGEELTEEQTQQKLASLLEEKAASMETKFAETEIAYPLIKADDSWKIVALDENTVRLMSANFTNVQDEINQSLVEMENAGSAEAPAAPDAASTGTIDMTNDKFTIHYKQHRVAKDFAGAPCLLVYYDYSNNGTAASSAMVDVSLQAYQNDQVLTAAIPEASDEAIDQFMAEVQPGQTVTVCQAFTLTDESDVTLQAGEAFSFGGGTVTSQILKIK